MPRQYISEKQVLSDRTYITEARYRPSINVILQCPTKLEQKAICKEGILREVVAEVVKISQAAHVKAQQALKTSESALVLMQYMASLQRGPRSTVGLSQSTIFEEQPCRNSIGLGTITKIARIKDDILPSKQFEEVFEVKSQKVLKRIESNKKVISAMMPTDEKNKSVVPIIQPFREHFNDSESCEIKDIRANKINREQNQQARKNQVVQRVRKEPMNSKTTNQNYILVALDENGERIKVFQSNSKGSAGNEINCLVTQNKKAAQTIQKKMQMSVYKFPKIVSPDPASFQAECDSLEQYLHNRIKLVAGSSIHASNSDKKKNLPLLLPRIS